MVIRIQYIIPRMKVTEYILKLSIIPLLFWWLSGQVCVHNTTKTVWTQAFTTKEENGPQLPPGRREGELKKWEIFWKPVMYCSAGAEVTLIVLSAARWVTLNLFVRREVAGSSSSSRIASPSGPISPCRSLWIQWRERTGWEYTRMCPR